MRVPTLTLIVAGGMLVLGGCASTAPIEMAMDGTVTCGIGGEPTPTGRNTGDLRRDYECRGTHVNAYRDTNAGNAASGRNGAITRALNGQRPGG